MFQKAVLKHFINFTKFLNISKRNISSIISSYKAQTTASLKMVSQCYRMTLRHIL